MAGGEATRIAAGVEARVEAERRRPMVLKEAYPLRPPFSYAAIKRDPITEEIVYEVVEPTLMEHEKEILEKLKEKLLDELKADLESFENREKAEEFLMKEIERVMKKYKLKVPKETLSKLFYYISRDFIGYGKIEPLMIDPLIEDISCDGPQIPIYVWHRDYESMPTNVQFDSEEELSSFIIRLAYRAGKHISIANPIVEARLPDGSRAVLTLGTEVTRRGSTFTIRKFRREPFTIVDLIRLNTVSAQMAAYFWYVIEHKASIIVAGGIATGKTTLLNCLSMFIKPEYKIVTVEETPELNLPHENWIASVTRAGYGPEGRGAITLFDLVKAALRQRPDYIIVGEVRGEEAYVLFQAMATGHLGFCTIHAETIDRVFKRLASKPMNIPKVFFEAIDVLTLQVRTERRGRPIRRTKVVAEVTGLHPETLDPKILEVFRWDPATDQHVYLGRSYQLEKIAADKGISMAEVERELERRRQVLEWMVRRNLRDYKTVASIIREYYADPRRVLMKARVGA
ncbi:MAG TPA: type IV secretory pathway protein [Candidatus Bathyarchaeota archaeon]|nr:type IV secretory pathway protein [Candidatus Bathyarchaeota archaeon]